MTKKWLREHKRDYYHQMALEEGYRSRAAYKLLQMAEKYELIKPGDVVLDFGASPGGWMQGARTLVGDVGYVLGVDLRPIEGFDEPNVTSVVADVEKLEPKDILNLLPRRPNVVLSDMSPNLSGVWSLDHIRQVTLARTALRLATQLLTPSGNFVVKVFQGELFKAFLEDVRRHFRVVRVVKPRASRSESAEMYLACLDFKG